jgi:hypothetical protein
MSQTVAGRFNAFTSPSCGIGVSGSTKKIGAPAFPSAISAPISAGRRLAGRSAWAGYPAGRKARSS